MTNQIESIHVSEIAFNSAAYRRCLRLRHDILRVPLGLSLYQEQLGNEGRHRHFIARQRGSIVGSVMVVLDNATAIRLRQVFVIPQCQGLGVGRQLISHIEETMKAEGAMKSRLLSRVEAMPFYARLDYKVCKPYERVLGVAHRMMCKRL